MEVSSVPQALIIPLPRHDHHHHRNPCPVMHRLLLASINDHHRHLSTFADHHLFAMGIIASASMATISASAAFYGHCCNQNPPPNTSCVGIPKTERQDKNGFVVLGA